MLNAPSADMSLKPSLRLDFCTYNAAKYAVMHWHYSKRMPAGKLVKIGIWENEVFIGAVIFGRGASNNLPKHLGLTTIECCELVRVALDEHITPTSRIISIAIKMLRKFNPGIKTIFSYADQTNQEHQGTIYRAGNWQYHGLRRCRAYFLDTRTNEYIHQRSINAKYRYVRNYPKYYEPLPNSDTSPFQGEEHSAILMSALQLRDKRL